MSLTLILGGARSGKSRFAQKRALELSSQPLYVATSRLWDEQHQARIERHRRERGPEWTTIEEPVHWADPRCRGRVAVVDCLTLWLTNLFGEEQQDVEVCLRRAHCELERALEVDATWLVVSNELGQSLHAPTPMGRRFVDLSGLCNQLVAERADTVVLMAAGIPVPIKGRL